MLEINTEQIGRAAAGGGWCNEELIFVNLCDLDAEYNKHLRRVGALGEQPHKLGKRMLACFISDYFTFHPKLPIWKS